MNDRKLAVVVVVAAVALAVAGPAATSAVATMSVAERPAVQENGTTNASMGASISGFMQASEADAEGEVDDGIFRAQATNASNETRRALVTQRTETLEARLGRLQERREALLAQDGNLTVRERARAARLSAEINSLKQAVETTNEVARAAGINSTALDRLRRNASELSGSEVAEIAGSVADPPRPGTPGEPADRGPPATDDPVNETTTPDRSGNVTETPQQGNENAPDGESSSGSDDRERENSTDDSETPVETESDSGSGSR